MSSPEDPPLTTWAAKSERPWVNLLRTRIGPLMLLVLTPPVALVLWVVCRHLDGSLARLLDADGRQVLIDRWPVPDLASVRILVIFALFEYILLVALPGRDFEGPRAPSGVRPRYKLNGVAAWAVSHGAFFGLSHGAGLFSAGIVWDHFGPMLATLVLFALALCLGLYAKGRWAPSTEDRSVSDSFVWDYFWGTELHPRALGVSLKQLINCRISMMGWSLIVCSFAAKQAELYGHASNTMLVSAAITVVYLFKFFWWEDGYFTSLDIMHDRFGYYICWGVLAWVPSVYALPAQYLTTHPRDLAAPVAAAIFALGVLCVYVNYAADAQRQRVRATQGNTTVWGRKPAIIHARYRTADGAEHDSLLLASGWWGVARHFHYVPEIGLAVAWTLPAGFGHFLPWFYVVFLTILLLDRATRDDRRCAKKYGAFWDDYRERVPWKVIPGLY